MKKMNVNPTDIRGYFETLLIAGIFALNSTGALFAYEWKKTETEGLRLSLGQKTGNPESADSGMRWSAFRIDEISKMHLSLIDVEDFMNNKLASNLRDPLWKNSSGKLSTLKYSLSELWSQLAHDDNVVAVVPVGYLESGGVPQIAGMLRIGGHERNPLMHAPTLTSIFCIDNKARRERVNANRLKKGEQPITHQWTYTFPVQYNSHFNYKYVKDFSGVAFNLEGPTPINQRIDFKACEDMVQVGPRIIEPRKRKGKNGLRDRRSDEIEKNDEIWKISVPRTILAFDLAQNLTVMTSLGPSKLSFFADVIEDSMFYYSATPQSCAAAERSVGGDGEVNSDGHRSIRSKSCEYWAVALTSFEHSGFIVRPSANEMNSEIKIGSTDSTIPAAIIVKKKEAIPIEPN